MNGLTESALLAILCTLAPCVEQGNVMQVPVPEVHYGIPEERWPSYQSGERRVVFVPMPRGV